MGVNTSINQLFAFTFSFFVWVSPQSILAQELPALAVNALKAGVSSVESEDSRPYPPILDQKIGKNAERNQNASYKEIQLILQSAISSVPEQTTRSVTIRESELLSISAALAASDLINLTDTAATLELYFSTPPNVQVSQIIFLLQNPTDIPRALDIIDNHNYS